MRDELRSVLVGTSGLGVAALAAVALALARGPIGAQPEALRSALRAALVAWLLQIAHFAEELATGFFRLFPEQLGLVAWSERFFVSFNLFWIGLWALSVYGLAGRNRFALPALWFLALAGVANGVAHPVLSLRAGGYFPGLVTSPFVGVAGWLLLRRLARITAGSGAR